jgi:hypothetical protein
MDSKFACPHCAEIFTRKSNLVRHIHAKHRTDSQVYKCNLCDYSTKRSDVFLRHSRQCQLKPKQHECNYCEIRTTCGKRKRDDFSDENRSKKQKTWEKSNIVVQQNGKKILPGYTCHICNSRFPNRTTLYKHQHQVNF